MFFESKIISFISIVVAGSIKYGIGMNWGGVASRVAEATDFELEEVPLFHSLLYGVEELSHFSLAIEVFEEPIFLGHDFLQLFCSRSSRRFFLKHVKDRIAQFFRVVLMDERINVLRVQISHRFLIFSGFVFLTGLKQGDSDTPDVGSFAGFSLLQHFRAHIRKSPYRCFQNLFFFLVLKPRSDTEIT